MGAAAKEDGFHIGLEVGRNLQHRRRDLRIEADGGRAHIKQFRQGLGRFACHAVIVGGDAAPIPTMRLSLAHVLQAAQVAHGQRRQVLASQMVPDDKHPRLGTPGKRLVHDAARQAVELDRWEHFITDEQDQPPVAGPDEERFAGAMPVQGVCEQNLFLGRGAGDQVLELGVEYDGRGVRRVFRVRVLPCGQHWLLSPGIQVLEN